MQPEIRTIPSIRIVYGEGQGFDGSFSAAAGAAFKAVGEYLAKYDLNSRVGMVIGFTPDDMRTVPHAEQRYRACYVVNDSDPLPADPSVHEDTVAGGKFAIFPHKGPYAGLTKAWERVMGEWMPASGLTMRYAMPFEVYVDDPDTTSADEMLTEIWMPVE